MYNQNPTFAGMGSNPLMSPQHAIQPTPISMLQQYPAPGLGLPLHPPQDPLFVTQKFPTPRITKPVSYTHLTLPTNREV